jgi:DNA helicase MCM8
MSKAAGDILQQFYLKLRKRSTSADGTPITARQLESLVRLAEARARVDLREEVTAEDAKVNSVFLKEEVYFHPSSLAKVRHSSLMFYLEQINT